MNFKHLDSPSEMYNFCGNFKVVFPCVSCFCIILVIKSFFSEGLKNAKEMEVTNEISANEEVNKQGLEQLTIVVNTIQDPY